MRFIIDVIAALQNSYKFSVAGRLVAETAEDDELMAMMVEGLKSMDNIIHGDVRVAAMKNSIVYNDIPIVTCANIIRTFERNFGISIPTELSSSAEVIPSSCRPLARMEISRLFS